MKHNLMNKQMNYFCQEDIGIALHNGRISSELSACTRYVQKLRKINHMI